MDHDSASGPPPRSCEPLADPRAPSSIRQVLPAQGCPGQGTDAWYFYAIFSDTTQGKGIDQVAA